MRKRKKQTNHQDLIKISPLQGWLSSVRGAHRIIRRRARSRAVADLRKKMLPVIVITLPMLRRKAKIKIKKETS